MGETEEFNTLAFEKRLMQLKDTQECIQGLSSWCLKQREHHKKIVASWLNVLKRVKIEQRLVLFYLANDVIQYSKRKNYEFVESWGHNLQKATPLVREEKVRHKILRIFKIWEQRAVYDEEFLSDLTGLLSAGATKKTDDDPLDFQPQQLVNKIKQCTVLEADTDLRLKYIHESHLQLSDADALCTSLKERSNKDDVEKELNEGIQCVERYTQALQREIVAREALLALLSTGTQYYSTQRGEVKVVAYAYKNFGARVRALKRKLDELTPALARGAPSPPQRDEDVPSPGPDEDLDLPAPQDQGEDISYNIDQTFNTSVSADGSLYNLGLSSFLTSDNPMSFFNDSDTVSANRIEVINSRPNEKQDFDINSFLKTLVPNDSNPANSDNNSVSSATLSQKSGDALPGLDLLTPDSTGNPAPPTSFYGTMDDDPEPYHPELSTQWNNAWNLPPAPVPAPLALPLALPPAPPAAPRGPCADTPESPPPAPPPPPAPVVPLYSHLQDMPVADVDHRGILPPPPPPPVLPLLGDVDHRNLISLTHQRPRGMAALDPRPVAPPSLDQDYRVPPLVPPSDIVESVDMDLSEDEDQQGMYPNQNEHRRNNFNNNKVLVGGDNGKTNHKENHSRQHHDIDQIPPITNPLPPINSPLPHLNNPPPNLNSPLLHLNNPNVNSPLPHPNLNSPLPRLTNPPNLNSPLTLHNNPPNLNSPPPHHNSPLPLSNPFDNMPPGLKMNIPFKSFPQFARDEKEENSNDSSYDEDLRSRGLDHLIDRPQSPEFENIDSEYQQRPPFNNQRFPRNWGPRTFRPPFGHQMWPRNGPRPPNRWMGPRQRFW